VVLNFPAGSQFCVLPLYTGTFALLSTDRPMSHQGLQYSSKSQPNGSYSTKPKVKEKYEHHLKIEYNALHKALWILTELHFCL